MFEADFTAGADEVRRAEFREWARRTLAPLPPLIEDFRPQDSRRVDRILGDARVIAFGEAFHNAAEPLSFRNALFRHVVKTRAFRAIAIESGVVESRRVFDYVRRAEPADTLTSAALHGITWGFERQGQTRDLIAWLRKQNRDRPADAQLAFFGFDVTGMRSTTREYPTHAVALEALLSFAETYDPTNDAWRVRFAPFEGRLQFYLANPRRGSCYADLSSEEYTALGTVIDDLLGWILRDEDKLTRASGSEEYFWAATAASSLRNIDSYLRCRLLGNAGLSSFDAAAADVRDRAQAENILRILARPDVGGRLLVFASRFHTSAAPLEVSWPKDPGPHIHRPALSHVRASLQSELVSIGHVSGGGATGIAPDERPAPAPPAHSLDALAGELGQESFILDLRKASASVREWLKAPHLLVAGQQSLWLRPAEAFDVLYYTKRATPAANATAEAA